MYFDLQYLLAPAAVLVFVLARAIFARCGMLHFEKKRFHQSLQYLSWARALCASLEYCLTLAYAFCYLGRYIEAEQEIKRFSRGYKGKDRDQRLALAWISAGSIAFENGKYETSIGFFLNGMIYGDENYLLQAANFIDVATTLKS